MIYSFVLLLISVFFAKSFQNKAVYIDNLSQKQCGWVPKYNQANKAYFLLILLLTLYSGLRSRGNDTGAYIGAYLYDVEGSLKSFEGISFGFLDEPGFEIYQVLVKMIAGNNYARFLTITALITCASSIAFFRKYSSDFSLAVFIYIASTYYSYAMAALRQCLAMAIGIWAIPLIYKKKWIKAAVVLMVAVSFHKLIIIFALAVFLNDNVWTWKTGMIVLGTTVLAIGFSTIVPVFSSTLGYNEDYMIWLASTQGTNIFRVLVWLLPAVLSFVYRNSVNASCNPMQKMIINLSIVGSMIMFLASFGAANMVARMAFYFYPFFVLSFTELITPKIVGNNCGTLKSLCKIGFFSYYLILNWNPSNFFVDTMKHNSIIDLFRSEVLR